MMGRHTRQNNRELLEQLYQVQDKLCAHCGRVMYLPWLHPVIQNPMDYASIDHLEARFMGGSTDLRNVVGMHRKCNSAKNHRPPTGCERIFHALVLARLNIDYDLWMNRNERRVTLADVWPKTANG